MGKPNCFIVGAPKCGTTALARYLGRHTQVFFSDPKEPHYFVYEDMPSYSNYDFESYSELFDGANAKHKIIAEGSVWYLKSGMALRKIFDYNPDSRIIVMLRRPDEMVYSMHSTNLKYGYEHVKCFCAAWHEGMDHNARERKTMLCRDESILQYHKIAGYREQLMRLYSIFPEDQIHIILFDDFQKDTVGEFVKVQKFLCLNSEEADIEFNIVNENAVNISSLVAKLTNNPPKFIVRQLAFFKKLIGVQELNIINRLRGFNERKIHREDLGLELKNSIVRNYLKDIEYLEMLLQRDLSTWKTGA